MNKPDLIETAKKRVNEYISNVEKGKRLSGELEKLAIKRYHDDRKTAHLRGLYFDELKASKAIFFFQFLNHFKGAYAGKPFILPGWQAFIIWNIFGWMKAETNKRRFTEAYIKVAKKNGKSTFAAAIETYMLMADGEAAPEIYSAATTRDQASIVFDTAVNMIKQSPKIRNKVQIWKKAITNEKNAGTLQPVSSEAGNVEGKNSHCAIIDEYHLHKTSEVKDNLRSGMAGREQPLLLTITTAGYNRQSPCYRKEQIIISILKGQIIDDSQFGIIYDVDEGDEWTNPAIFEKANPNLGASPSLDFLIEELKTAQNESGEKEVSFKTKHLNMWTDAAAVWISDELWMRNNLGPLPEEIQGAICVAGLDLSSVRDLTALVLVFQFDDIYHVLPFFWMPELNYEERVKKDGINYDIWIKEKYIKTTPGNAIDYDYLKADIMEIAKKYQIKEIAFDRWNSPQIVTQLIDEGMVVTPFGQGFGSMSTPTKTLETLVLKGKINHAGNPVLRWMCSNIEIQKNPAGDIKIDKGKSSEKVDGMVSLVMALGQIIKTPEQSPDIDIW